MSSRAEARLPGPVIDSLVFHDWASTLTLTPYLCAAYKNNGGTTNGVKEEESID